MKEKRNSRGRNFLAVVGEPLEAVNQRCVHTAARRANVCVLNVRSVAEAVQTQWLVCSGRLPSRHGGGPLILLNVVTFFEAKILPN